jgi:hypothetical protein
MGDKLANFPESGLTQANMARGGKVKLPGRKERIRSYGSISSEPFCSTGHGTMIAQRGKE